MSGKQVVAHDEHPVADEPEVPVGVARQRDHVPSVDAVAFVQQLRVAIEADERQRLAVTREHRLGHLGRDAVQAEPRRDPFGPVVRAPHAVALLVVEAALVDGRAGHLPRHLAAPDVVGMEVGDHDPVDRPVELVAEELVQAR